MDQITNFLLKDYHHHQTSVVIWVVVKNRWIQVLKHHRLQAQKVAVHTTLKQPSAADLIKYDLQIQNYAAEEDYEPYDDNDY